MSMGDTREPSRATSRVATTVAGIIALLAMGVLALFVYPWVIYFVG